MVSEAVKRRLFAKKVDQLVLDAVKTPFLPAELLKNHGEFWKKAMIS
jgi:hypothetical protein